MNPDKILGGNDNAPHCRESYKFGKVTNHSEFHDCGHLPFAHAAEKVPHFREMNPPFANAIDFAHRIFFVPHHRRAFPQVRGHFAESRPASSTAVMPPRHKESACPL